MHIQDMYFVHPIKLHCTSNFPSLFIQNQTIVYGGGTQTICHPTAQHHHSISPPPNCTKPPPVPLHLIAPHSCRPPPPPLSSTAPPPPPLPFTSTQLHKTTTYSPSPHNTAELPTSATTTLLHSSTSTSTQLHKTTTCSPSPHSTAQLRTSATTTILHGSTSTTPEMNKIAPPMAEINDLGGMVVNCSGGKEEGEGKWIKKNEMTNLGGMVVVCRSGKEEGEVGRRRQKFDQATFGPFISLLFKYHMIHVYCEHEVDKDPGINHVYDLGNFTDDEQYMGSNMTFAELLRHDYKAVSISQNNFSIQDDGIDYDEDGSDMNDEEITDALEKVKQDKKIERDYEEELRQLERVVENKRTQLNGMDSEYEDSTDLDSPDEASEEEDCGHLVPVQPKIRRSSVFKKYKQGTTPQDTVFYVGQEFDNAEKLKKAIRDYCIFHARDFGVREGITQTKYVVDLRDRTCSCNTWQLSGIPCKHAVAAIWKSVEHPEQYVASCFTKFEYLKAYNFPLEPLNGPNEWPVSLLQPILAPPLKKERGKHFKSEKQGKKHVKSNDNAPCTPEGLRSSFCKSPNDEKYERTETGGKLPWGSQSKIARQLGCAKSTVCKIFNKAVKQREKGEAIDVSSKKKATQAENDITKTVRSGYNQHHCINEALIEHIQMH
ncbi:hypothetical protein RDABS01_014619 [Bienertia sinuspersici]